MATGRDYLRANKRLLNEINRYPESFVTCRQAGNPRPGRATETFRDFFNGPDHYFVHLGQDNRHKAFTRPFLAHALPEVGFIEYTEAGGTNRDNHDNQRPITTRYPALAYVTEHGKIYHITESGIGRVYHHHNGEQTKLDEIGLVYPNVYQRLGRFPVDFQVDLYEALSNRLDQLTADS